MQKLSNEVQEGLTNFIANKKIEMLIIELGINLGTMKKMYSIRIESFKQTNTQDWRKKKP